MYVFLKKSLVLLLAVSFTGGCASRSSSIKAAYVSPLEYHNYNCDQIGQEMSRIGRRSSQASDEQDSVATKDAVAMGVGLVLFWPSLFFLAAGDDKKEEISRLKGEYEALEQCAIQKDCKNIIAQVEKDRKLYEQQDQELKSKEALIEKRMQQCADILGPASCNREAIVAEIEKQKT